MKTRQLSLNLQYGITKEQACILCHLKQTLGINLLTKNLKNNSL